MHEFDGSYKAFCERRFKQRMSNGLGDYYELFTTQGSPGPEFSLGDESSRIVRSYWMQNPSHLSWMLSAHRVDESTRADNSQGVYKIDVFLHMASREATATGLIVSRFGGQGIGSHLFKASKWVLQAVANELQVVVVRAIVDAGSQARRDAVLLHPHLVNHLMIEDCLWGKLFGDRPKNPKIFHPIPRTCEQPSDCPYHHQYCFDSLPPHIHLPKDL